MKVFINYLILKKKIVQEIQRLHLQLLHFNKKQVENLDFQ